ncbi:MAG: very short patch repair endonuclease [Haliea sp.]|uniref:very short patch repair endonuclease n=1 Tax=Haliea sp. TaxID=1932666 RepID=UPI000C3B9441|nr:very short patch repair endonuclease [Haliea sp.]MBM69480.1 very short patch repair endonuclease [Haliea sp.]|tara:strand:+ start:510 stop:944 length:435 start_codon:yes stop_codon:yes gene_type:complete
MADVVSPRKRSQMMAGIRGKDTKPELIVRRELFKRGYRYRLHKKGLPGRPDLVFPKYHAVIFVNGCFWHGHGCHLFKWPNTNREFWEEKILGNRARDLRNIRLLQKAGWRVHTVWECSLRGKSTEDISTRIDLIEDWLHLKIPA